MRIVINSLGECYDGDTELGGGFVNTSQMARQVLSEDQCKKWRKFKGVEAEALDRYVNAKIEEHFIDSAWESMPLPVFDFYMRVTKLQSQNDARFRVWGEKAGKTFKSKEQIWLVTEFIDFVDNTEFWKSLDQIASELKGSIETLHESPCHEKSWQVGVNGHKQFDSLIDKTAIYGENHGRMERQVELRKNITKLSKERDSVSYLKDEILNIRNATQAVWEECGVGVV